MWQSRKHRFVQTRLFYLFFSPTFLATASVVLLYGSIGLWKYSETPKKREQNITPSNGGRHIKFTHFDLNPSKISSGKYQMSGSNWPHICTNVYTCMCACEHTFPLIKLLWTHRRLDASERARVCVCLKISNSPNGIFIAIQCINIVVIHINIYLYHFKSHHVNNQKKFESDDTTSFEFVCCFFLLVLFENCDHVHIMDFVW